MEWLVRKCCVMWRAWWWMGGKVIDRILDGVCREQKGKKYSVLKRMEEFVDVEEEGR
jgi:hypothetical protein